MWAGLIIGTAGHIDHGKTSLIKALTGVDTDRLTEEKRRGISIDLGFAHLDLPGGRRLSFIDVPGHERFIRNMLAGAAGIEAVLLVIAADESVKPQTREHFQICRLLNVQRGLVVLTKADLATPDQLQQACAAARELTRQSFLANAPVVAVSSVTGAGLDELKHRLADLAAHKTVRNASGLPRLPIDRSFALKGFGTVVTGTLMSGSFAVGDTVHIQPSRQEARIRGMQIHGDFVETARAGDRVAINLSGVDSEAIRRGEVLTGRSLFEATNTMDVSLEWIEPPKGSGKPAEMLLDLGTAEIPIHLKPLSDRFARLLLTEPTVALPGDRFILRRPSPPATVAGGVVADPFPPKRITRAKTVERLTRLAASSPVERLTALVGESVAGLPIKQLAAATGMAPEEIAKTPQLVIVNNHHALTEQWIADRRRRLLDWLTNFHQRNPASPGAPLAQARLGLDISLFRTLVADCPLVKVIGECIALADYQPRMNQSDQRISDEIEQAFRQAAFQPPPVAEILAGAKVDSKTARGLLESLVKANRLVRLAPDLLFHADAIAHIRTSLSAHRGRRFTVPEFKTWTNISRKYAIPLLEYLDQQRITRRDGDSRIVL